MILHIVSIYGNSQRKKQIKNSKKADEISKKLLLNLIKKNKNTAYGKKYDFKNIKSLKDYQDKVPFSYYEDYQEYIEETLKTGKQNLLTKDKIDFFAKTSGTTGIMKRIPVVKKAKKAYIATVAMYVNIIEQEMKKRGYKVGRGLNLVEEEKAKTEGGIREGLISSYTIQSGKFIVPIITCIPKEALKCGEEKDMKYIKAFYGLKEKNLTYISSVFTSNVTDLMKYIIDNHVQLIKDIKNGKISDNVDIPEDIKKALNKKLKPDKERAKELRAIMKKPKKQIMKRIWPRLSVIIGIGTGEFEGFSKKLRDYCGDEVSFFNETYSSSECLIANAMEIEQKEYMLLYDNAFFEFIPVDEEEKRPLLFHELEEGKLYEIVITNLSGLYRYRIKDVIRVTRFIEKVPMLQFSYRKQQLINITGVKLTGEQISNAITNFSKETNVKVLEYCIYPDTSESPWRMKVFIETNTKLTKKQKSSMNKIFDEELEKENKEHGRMLKIGETSPTHIYRIKEGTFKKYRDYRVSEGASQNQVKSIRLIKNERELIFFQQAVIEKCD